MICLTIIPLCRATDAELVIAAHHAGQLADDPTRAACTKYLRRRGYRQIQIDASHRLDDPYALVDFEVAKPIK